MVIYSIIKHLDLYRRIEFLRSGIESFQTRIKVELKSYESRLCSDGTVISPAIHLEMSYYIKHRAPPLSNE